MDQKIIAQLNRECDELAASHWSLAAGDRELAYKKWILACKKMANYIEKNNDSKQKLLDLEKNSGHKIQCAI
jgi:hypothetical protein